MKTKLTKLLKFVLKMMRFLEILNSQQMKHPFIMILSLHLNMQWICQLLNGKDHKKLLLLKLNPKCIEIK